MKLPPIILASTSPRRRELMRKLGVEFQIETAHAIELHQEDFTASEISQLNAYRKAWSVAIKKPDSLVIGADTLVTLKSKLFGKPRDLVEAKETLALLQGETHQVITGVCMVHLESKKQSIFAEVTDVKFKPLSARQISDYLALINPLDKAGSYAIQEHGERIVESIDGSLDNVIGLPTERLKLELDAWEKSISESLG